MLEPNIRVAAMDPYALADLNVTPGARLISLAQNESLRAPTPLAHEAACRASKNGAAYPDPDWEELRSAIAHVHRLKSESILCGAGSMELINAVLLAYVGPEDQILVPAHSYAFFRTMAQTTGADYHEAAHSGFTPSVEALLGAVGPRTKVVCLANPGNPTGTYVRPAELRKLRAELPEDVLLILDEAYGEFLPYLEPLFDLAEDSNTVILRTFSKAYGLAGMRVGWGYFPNSVAVQTRKMMNPNNISAASQAAATAAMLDQDYMQETRAQTVVQRDRLTAACRSLDLTVPDSVTNFVLIQFQSAKAAQRADLFLRNHGILLRSMGGYALPDCLRATIGPSRDMDMAIQCLRRWHQMEVE